MNSVFVKLYLVYKFWGLFFCILSVLSEYLHEIMQTFVVFHENKIVLMEFLKIFFNKKNLYLHRASCVVCKGNASAAVLHEPRIVHITVLQTQN